MTEAPEHYIQVNSMLDSALLIIEEVLEKIRMYPDELEEVYKVRMKAILISTQNAEKYLKSKNRERIDLH